MWDLVYLICGLGALWAGTELVLRATLTIATHYQLSHVFIGLTILAIGSDLPELVVAIDASMLQLKGQETSGLIVGNALGSSFNQITVVLGIGGMVGYLTLSRKAIKRDGMVLLGVLVLFFLVAFDGRISRVEGISLVVVYLIYYSRLVYGEKIPQRLKKGVPQKLWKHLIYFFGGMLLVIVASDIVVNEGLALANAWGVSQSYIAIVFIALGTSLPELALSINAAAKGAPGLSVGNVIGSNIFDLLVPVGLGATISDLHFGKDLLWRDVPILFLITLLVLFFFYKNKGLQKKEAITLMVIYILYVVAKSLGF